jgi:hypothetical protein
MKKKLNKYQITKQIETKKGKYLRLLDKGLITKEEIFTDIEKFQNEKDEEIDLGSDEYSDDEGDDLDDEDKDEDDGDDEEDEKE